MPPQIPDIIGPIQPYPLDAAIANAYIQDMIGINFWIADDHKQNPMLFKIALKTTAIDDDTLIKDAVKYFTPVYLGGVRVCIKDGISIICLAIDSSKRVDPIADYDRAMAIIGKR